MSCETKGLSVLRRAGASSAQPRRNHSFIHDQEKGLSLQVESSPLCYQPALKERAKCFTHLMGNGENDNTEESLSQNQKYKMYATLNENARKAFETSRL